MKSATAVTGNQFDNCTHSAVVIASASTLVLAADLDREYALIQNMSNETIYLGIGIAATTAGIALGPASGAGATKVPGGSYEIKLDTMTFKAIYAITSGGINKTLNVAYAKCEGA